MKILHTADWHIGKRLHKHDLNQDFDHFITWLLVLVKERAVDVVLVSGDVFDLANPSSEARRAYFQALLQLSKLNCKLILTGGNHDSPAVLNGPKELLEAMDIHVVGSLPTSITDCLIPIKNKAGETQAVVAAIPYLRDADLRSVTDDFSYEHRVSAIREGITHVFTKAAEACATNYPNVPAIAMGHLYAAGVSTSESERDIQLGNEASFEATGFGNYFKYVALGHIHKPQKVNANIPVYYSGSPIPLSFSEREDNKRLLIVNTENWEVEDVPIPKFRRLLRISGTLEQLVHKLGALVHTVGLDILVEVELEEDQYDPSKIIDLDKLVLDFNQDGVEIVKHRVTFKNKVRGSAELFSTNENLEDLKPQEVFHKLLQKASFDKETNHLIAEAFSELMEEVNQTEGHEN